MSVEITIQPIGKKLVFNGKGSILAATQESGILLNATCGGEGICGRCVIQVISGQVSPPNPTEESTLGSVRIDEGWRLACQVRALDDTVIYIPPDSQLTTQRIQTEGMTVDVALDPAVTFVDIPFPLAASMQPESVLQHLHMVLTNPTLVIADPMREHLVEDLHRFDHHCSVFLRGEQVIGLRPADTSALGLAVDLGTTKLACYLVDLSNGKTLAASGVMNPQIAYGEDVMARINYAMTKPNGADELRQVVLDQLNQTAGSLCKQASRDIEDVADVVLVGNTAMHHLVLGLPVSQLGLAPYIPAEYDAIDIGAKMLGLQTSPDTYVHLLPNIAGFVGADHVAMLLGSQMLENKGVVLGLDIGTNTEISLIAHGKHYACSTASGPAFEGAHIQYGMRAAPGAIEKVFIQNNQVKYQTIDNLAPIGLCGSGILDLVAQLLKEGVINARGSFAKGSSNPRVRKGQKGYEYVLVEAGENAGKEISFNRKDISEIQLVKGSIRAGIEILLEKAGVPESDIDQVMIAGAFGTYLDVKSGIEIGMFPNLDLEKFVQVGNAAGTGAKMALLSRKVRSEAVQIAKHVQYVELTTEPGFTDTFARCLSLGK